NQLLLAGGFAPVYPEHDLDAPELASSRAAVRQVLHAHEPFPALAVDRTWNILDTNSSVRLLTRSAAPELLEPPVNALRLTLHPDGMAPSIANLPARAARHRRRARSVAAARRRPRALVHGGDRDDRHRAGHHVVRTRLGDVLPGGRVHDRV